MKSIQVFAWALMLGILLPFTGTAQRGSGGWCVKNNYNNKFDPKTLVELKGTIVSVDKITPEKGMSVGIHLVIKSGNDEQMSVHLGPEWFVSNQELQFAAGDQVVVKGSKVTWQNAPAVIAMSVAKGDVVLTLRDKNGNPAWNGCQPGRGGRRGRVNN